MKYKMNSYFSIDVGFEFTAAHVQKALKQTNNLLKDLPSTMYKRLDLKTTSAIVGAFFCEEVASVTTAIVNPIEKGYPDIIPAIAEHASEKELRRYPKGIEVKCTIGNIETGAKLKVGDSRIEKIIAINWQAHHRQGNNILGLVWDFVHDSKQFSYPVITGVFYSGSLLVEDWGSISGVTGRNTKVTAMTKSGRNKMGSGWIALLDDNAYIFRYQELLKFNHTYNDFCK